MRLVSKARSGCAMHGWASLTGFPSPTRPATLHLGEKLLSAHHLQEGQGRAAPRTVSRSVQVRRGPVGSAPVPAFVSKALSHAPGSVASHSPRAPTQPTCSPWRATGGVVAEATAMPGVATVCCTMRGDSR